MSASAGASGRRTSSDVRLALVRVLPAVDGPLTAALAATLLLGAGLAVAAMVASAALVAAVASAVGTGATAATARQLAGPLAVVVGVLALGQAVAQAQRVLTMKLGRALDAHLRARAMRAVLDPVGIGHLEDPALADLVSRARGAAMDQYTPALALLGLVDLLSARLQALASAGLIAVFFHWWVALGLLAALQVARSRTRRLASDRLEAGIAGSAGLLRRAGYFLDLAVSPGAAKEARVFGLSDWVVGSFARLWQEAMTELWAVRRRGTAAAAPWLLAGVGLLARPVGGGGGGGGPPPAAPWLLAGVLPPVLASVALAGWAAATGAIGLAALAVVAQAVFRLAAQLFASTHTESWLEHGATSVPAVLELEAATAAPVRAGRRSPADGPRREIRFRGVSFAYEGRAPVLDGLDLSIPAGRSLAVVGTNGAGKTTLIKLLCRLYEPAAGDISVDGVDVRELSLEGWRRRIAVIFQDFAHYDLPVADNVGFGAIALAGDRAALGRAARAAGAEALIARLPRGWDTVLSRSYAGGTDLSGGEWQRIALARALMAVEGGAGVLVLDEPTAALDVRAEAELFDRFMQVTRGLTTIVVSHRFGTVRRADRICVLDRGRVAEMGGHDELVAAGGLYARLFALQAARFAEASA
jgi:ATP-binding cassette subfamily B protein